MNTCRDLSLLLPIQCQAIQKDSTLNDNEMNTRYLSKNQHCISFINITILYWHFTLIDWALPHLTGYLGFFMDLIATQKTYWH